MKTILDVCCESKCFYFDKHDPRVLFCDCRKENKRIQNNRTCVVDPDEINEKISYLKSRQQEGANQ